MIKKGPVSRLTKQNAIAKLEIANKKIALAIIALQEIEADPEMNRFIGPDAAHFRSELEYINDPNPEEAGIGGFIKLLKQRYL